MYARVSTLQGKPEQIENGIRGYRDQVLPAAKKMTGFKGAFLMVDRKSGKAVGVTLWDTEKDLQASTKAADQLRAQASQSISASKPPLVEIFEVAVQA
jgi:heme-degrading monooxygenase HmoA